MRMRIAVLVAAVACGAALAAEPGFDTPPRARKSGDEVIVTFKLKTATDVEVAVLDAQGKVIRHLAAGVLGGKQPPPAPLRPGLSQKLSWDGRGDWKQPAGKGPFRVRVRAGMGVRFGRMVNDSPYNLGNVLCRGLVVDPATVNSDAPALFVSWYSQHDRESEPNHSENTASIYVGRVTIAP